MSAPHHCDPEPIFELADGSLGPDQEREVRTHLRDCRGCRNLYERELRLNASLGSLDFEQPRSVCQGVAMALPTRSLRARLLWAGLAIVLLLIQVVFAIVGPALLVALAVGAAVDLCIAAVYLAVSRRRAREV
jgi:predicted anti-sigma-YlaC factor YlaD